MTITYPTQPTDSHSPETRMNRLVDPGTLEVALDENGAMAARAHIEGTPVMIFAVDPRSGGGALGAGNCKVIVRAYREALAAGIPIVGLWHSGGARLQDGVASLHAVAEVFAMMTQASGCIPQLSLVLGAAAGGAAYGPALTDVVVMGPSAKVFITGPDIIRSVTGEEIDLDGLGSPDVHGRRSGVAHVTASSDSEAYARTRRLAGLLGVVRTVDEGAVADRAFAGLLPVETRRAYDVHPVIDRVLDEPGTELHAAWARNMVTVLGRFGGGTVGVVANNPLRKGGCLDSLSAEKAARFVRMCDSFGIPLIALVDVPGYLPGVGEEWGGVVRRGAKLLHAFADTSVPRVTVVTRKAYGGAYIAMNSHGLGATRVLAWEGAEIAVMGAIAAVRLLHRRQLAAVDEEHRPALEAQLAAAHENEAGGIQRAKEIGVIDEIIPPDATRRALARALAAAPQARGQLRNIPL
ncbi:acyl-CoA carboxylase subunit beta [Streptomyces decoyicus]|uniref:acyl-CoA carboxylase subunit beta n=1 Tax=Streptomyces decoyicus TaxID=249567 RepID=UPI003669EDD3